jgi:aspartate/methionine/tyrosine aminotransferase
VKIASRLDGIDFSLIRQINALATPLSVNLGIGEPNLEPDPELREMAVRATRVPWHYTLNAGTIELRREIASTMSGIYDPATEICATAGTEEGLFTAFQSFLDPGDEVLVPNPGFLAYATVASICGATSQSYALDPDGWVIDVGDLESKINRKTKIIVVNSPSNPLGATVDAERLKRIVELAEEHDCLVLSDEVYGEIYYGEKPASMAGMGANVIILSGLSKSHGMTGLRLGWIAAPESLTTPMVRMHQYVTTCASIFSQSLAEMILANKSWNRSWLEQMRAQFSTQQEAALFSIERELGVAVPKPAGAFYAFVPVPFCDTARFGRDLATEAAVLAIPGVAFGSAGEGFLRISYAASVDRLGTGIERIGRYLRTLNR